MKNDFEKDIKSLKRKMKKDRDFAIDVYRALCNMQWRKVGTEDEIYSCTWRYAGGLVAKIRNKGEDYLHFYCSGNEGIVTEEINKIFNGLGWIQHPYLDL